MTSEQKQKLQVSSAMVDTEIDESVTTTTIEEIDHNHPLFLQSSDTPGLALIGIKLSGPKNYILWSKSMRLVLLGKNKLGFIDGSCSRRMYKGELVRVW